MISKELRSIFTQAVGYAKSSKHEYLTLEHIFLMLIHDQTIENLFLDLGVDTNQLFSDVKKYIDENTPKLPLDIIDEPMETVSLASTIEYMIAHVQTSGKTNANVEDMFVAILKDEKSYVTYLLKKLGIQRVDILEEISHKETDDDISEDDNDIDNKVLDKNSTELVSVAKKGEIDPVIGREMEISRVIEILSRRKKNNPILVGEPGVGKTAIAEGLALEIAQGNVVGLGAQMPYDQGVAEATLAAYGLLGKEAPEYVAVPAKKVNQTNILEAYEEVYKVEAPKWLKEAANN